MSEEKRETEDQIQILDAISEIEIQHCRTLFQEYADSLDIDLEFQGFSAELAALPGLFCPPKGAILLAWENDLLLGCVALRPLEDSIAEIKRLYVRPIARSKGVGQALVCAIVDRAKSMQYERIRLDTLSSMKVAISLYKQLGFKEISPYCHNPLEEACFLELALNSE